MNKNTLSSNIKHRQHDSYPNSHLLNNLEEVFDHTESPEILTKVAPILEQATPIEIAYVSSLLPISHRITIYEALSNFERKMKMIIYASKSTRQAILDHLSDDQVIHLIDTIPPQKAIEIIALLDDEKKETILSSVEPQKLSRIHQIEQYDEDSAGRLMSNEFFSFPEKMTLEKVTSHIRSCPLFNLDHAVFVYGEEKVLKGYIPVRTLLVAPPDSMLYDILLPISHKVTADISREQIVSLFERYKLGSIPVTNDRNVMIGVITDVIVMDALEAIVDEMIAGIAGNDEDVSTDDPFIKRFRARFPWLIATACGGLINTKINGSLQWFEHGMTFVPLITGLSGNLGLQCSTVLVRSIATGHFTMRHQEKLFFKEILLGSFTGLAICIFCGIAVYICSIAGILQMSMSPLKLCIGIGSGLLGACLNAILIGSCSPIIFYRIGVDPALASGPIVTALNDITSTVFYFYISQLVIISWG